MSEQKMSDEEYVRANWIDEWVWTNERTDEPRIGTRVFLSWSAAAEFTRDRLEEIRQLREEIGMISQFLQGEPEIVAHGSPDETVADVRGICAFSRILARLESALAELQKGMVIDGQ